MAPDVRGALEEIIGSCGGMSHEEALAFLGRMQETGRLATDVWF